MLDLSRIKGNKLNYFNRYNFLKILQRTLVLNFLENNVLHMFYSLLMQFDLFF
jgi:hypothetical protein